MRRLYGFPGGVHPPEHKTESSGRPIAPAPLPARLVVPLLQHIGNPAKPVVQPGQKVLKGELIGKADGYISVSVHAPTSGTVRAVEPHPVPHPSGLPALCVVIEADGEERWVEKTPIDYLHLDPSEVRNRLRDMGLAGLGGAVFPTYVKLNPIPERSVPTLVLNGCECEPWITCDDRLMQERAPSIVAGARIMRHLLDAREVIVAIEDNKAEAIAAMREACRDTDFEVVVVPTLYPSGSGKQLIQLLTGREVPSGGRSTDVGVQVFNVGTAHALDRAVNHGEPLISRIVTVTGNVRRPQNFEAPLGMPLAELVTLAGTPREDTTGYIMGGPMMGFDLNSDQVPVVKAMNCVIARSERLFPPLPLPLPCIRCTRCAQVCPVRLQPQDLYWFARAKNFGKAQEHNLFDCIECGCCAYVCPSHIPLVDYYRFAKSEIWAREREKKAADRARERHEFRLQRLEREKKERAEKLAQKAVASKDTAAMPNPDAQAKRAAIQAAIERARAKQAGIEPRNVSQLPPDKLKEIQEIEARRAKLREAMQKQPGDTP
ncbi:electron transport complex subunit RsxC [Thiobacter aerophilum]|uniref:Ion-translocating oxidoreductase complex subunit C n=1 Tax=Thiobacter aerophilum TaxID=3121275 RepID=A0ABV0EE26_9BURK